MVDAVNRGDADGASACFTRDGCLITPDATAVHERDRIRPVLSQLISRRAEIEVDLSSVLRAGSVALAYERWQVRSPGLDGSGVEQTLNPTLVLHRLDDDWKLALAALWEGMRRPAW
ncbi:MAG TPA: nuclear transport factor 2 family protein [Solirubrobacterales bacterium]